jgi:hypothetical protein
VRSSCLGLIALLAGLCGQMACGPSPELIGRLDGLKNKIEALNTRVDEQDSATRKLREDAKEGLRRILCPDHIRTLMRLVASHCKPEEACMKDISQDVRMVSQGGLFVSLMNSQKHRVFYPAQQRTTAEEDQEDVELKALIEPPWEMSLRFLVVSRHDIDEANGLLQAEVRGRKIISKMLSMSYREYPKSKLVEADQVLHWVYAFPLINEKIDPKDKLPSTSGGKSKGRRPPPVVQGSKQDPLTRSVWVFRVNC